jgi:hypothetical protein
MLVTLVDDSISFNGSTPAYQALGGAEKAFASLPGALARRGHVVRAINRAPHSIGIENVSWVNWDGRKPPITEVLVAYRKPALLEFTRAVGARVLWVASHAGYLNTPSAQEVLNRTAARLVFSSEAQRKSFKLGAGQQIRLYTVSPAVRDEYRNAGPMDAKGRAPAALCTAHPKHGLDWLVKLWVERIRPRLPEAQLLVFSSSFKKAQGGGAAVPEDVKAVYAQVVEAAAHGVVIRAPGGDVDMASTYRQARVHLYPSAEQDLSCSTLLESQAVGVPAVCRPLGAVGERMVEGQSGFSLPSDEAFAEQAIRFMTDDAAFDSASAAARGFARRRSWDTVAGEFESAFR